MSDEIKAPEVSVWAEVDGFHVEMEFETDAHRAEVQALKAEIVRLTEVANGVWDGLRAAEAECDAARATVEVLAGELADERTLHQQTIAEVATLTAERDRLALQAGSGEVEIDQLRAGNANLIRNAETLADELVHATAERDGWRAKAEGARLDYHRVVAERDALAARLAQAERVVEAAREARTLLKSWYHDPDCSVGRRELQHFEGEKVCAHLDKRLRHQCAEALEPLVAAVDALDGTAGPGEEAHRYLSTACLHGIEPGREDLHRECQVDTKRYDGTHKTGATCKWCPARCVCACHTAGPGEEGSDGRS